ncbi:dienelactone hydrolase family protein [candidate division KSB1 bacterium]|nr:dienelactone hydrolase family protein [candidate division KSB1 bacterium]
MKLLICLALCVNMAYAQPTTHTLATYFNVAATPLQAYRALTTDWQLVEWLDAADAVFTATAGGPWRITFANGGLDEGLVSGAWPGDSLKYNIIAADTHNVTFHFDWQGSGTRVQLQDVVVSAGSADTSDARTQLADWWQPRLDKLAGYLNATPGAYVARPATAEAAPAVIVLHDRFGLNSTIRAFCDSVALSGYVAVAVDMFKGEVTSDPKQAERFTTLVVDSEAVASALQVYQYLAQNPDIQTSRIAVWGIGYGGSMAISAGAAQPKLRGCACWYPGEWPGPDALKRVSCPVQAVFGERDLTRPGPTVTAFSQAMSQAGVRVDIVLLSTAAAFADPNYAADYDAAITYEALQRTLVYLDKRLKL